MGYSPDKMLQARLFAYHDAQLYRVGTNHQHLPVNRPRCPFHHQQRDGAMAIANGGAAANYDPVRTGGPAAGGFGHGDAGWQLEGAAGRYDTRATDDHFTQAGNLFRLLSDEGKRNLVENIAGSLSQADAVTQDRQLGHFLRADPAYGHGVAEAIHRLGNDR
jgi:catalase